MGGLTALPYRLGVGIMLFNRLGEVFVAKRIDMISEAWQMPQGGVDAHETEEEAAWRELREETGVTRARLLAKSRDMLRYDLPDDLVPKIWGGKYRGQEQRWFALQFEGADAEINIATEEPEFSEWKWVRMEEVPALIVPFKRELYQKLVDEFAPLRAQCNSVAP